MYMELTTLFLLGFSSLFPLVNPIGTSIIVDPYFKNLKGSERFNTVFKVVTYGFILSLGSLIAGSWVLKFMGVSVDVTQAAGGLLISRMGLTMLNSEVKSDDNATDSSSKLDHNSLFYPIAFPLTVGPGCISVLITLSAHAHANSLEQTWLRLAVLSFSILSIFAITFVCFAFSDRVINRIGPSGSLVLNRLSAFLVFAIGVQMAVLGFKNIFPDLLK